MVDIPSAYEKEQATPQTEMPERHRMLTRPEFSPALTGYPATNDLVIFIQLSIEAKVELGAVDTSSPSSALSDTWFCA